MRSRSRFRPALLITTLVVLSALVAPAGAVAEGPGRHGVSEGPTEGAHAPQVGAVPGSFLVQFSPGERRGVLEALRRRVEVEDVASQYGTSLYRVQVPASAGPETLRLLRAAGGVEHVEAEVAFDLAKVPNDPEWGRQWGLSKIRADASWDVSTGSSDIVVAVLDTGVSAASDLGDALLPGKSFITTEPTSDDGHGHGTAVAGVIAARGGNASAIAGLCWDCRILPVKVLSASGGGTTSSVAQGIRWATDQGADVINMSLGGPNNSQALQDAAAYAVEKGVLLVAAAGNDGVTEPHYPAALPSVLGVAASDANDARYSWSNHGSWVDVAAPGCVRTVKYLTEIVGSCGTSFAAPIVAGTAALALSTPGKPTATAVAHALRETSLPKSFVARGRIDAAATVGTFQSPTSGPAPEPTSAWSPPSGAIPVTGDWDADGVDTSGWFSEGRWFLRNSHSAGAPDLELSYGRAGDIPVTGDWNGDGRDTVGVVRPVDGVLQFILRRTYNRGDDVVLFYGQVGDVPVTGDWNGDGVDTLGVVRGNTWILRYVYRRGADIVMQYGRSTDRPVSGDWNGDGTDTIGVLRGNTWILRYLYRSGADIVMDYGRSTDRPVTGDWNGDGTDTLGVVRGEQWILRYAYRSGADYVYDY